MTKKLFFLVGLAILILAPASAHACRCLEFESARGVIKDAAAIFEGIVLSVEEVGEWDALTTYEVLKSWKGTTVGSKVSVFHQRFVEGYVLQCKAVRFEQSETVVVLTSKAVDELKTESCLQGLTHYPDFMTVVEELHPQ
jgi:hypothetical protein